MTQCVSVAIVFACGILLLSNETRAEQPAATNDQVETPKPAKPTKSLVVPGEVFSVGDRTAFIFHPAEAKRRTPQPWVMYAPTLPAYPDKHERWLHQQLVSAGIAVAGIDAGEAYGSPNGQQAMSALYRELTEKRGFAKQACLLGRSRGGLWVSSWAITHPDRVSGLAGIYPVFDLQTYPGVKRAAPAYKLTVAQLQNQLDVHNPIARIDRLIDAKIPCYLIHGIDDVVVPFAPNSQTLLNRYCERNQGQLCTVREVQGQGHNFWPGFFRNQSLVDFVIRTARAGAGQKATIPPQRNLVEGISILQEIEYCRHDTGPLHLDLYRPRETKSPVPVVLWVHGGGWKTGSKERCPAVWLTRHGFAVASMNYRLTDVAQWPAQIEDCRAAVRWLREHAGQYGLHPDRIAAWGGSAGGHLVAVLGTAPLPEGEKISSRVQSVCNWYGPSDLLTMPPNVIGNGRTADDVAMSNGAKLLGGPVWKRPELAKQASAFHLVSANDPPFLIMHGEHDRAVPLAQSRKLHQQLQTAGVDSKFIILPKAGHGGSAFHSPESRQTILGFFQRTLTVDSTNP